MTQMTNDNDMAHPDPEAQTRPDPAGDTGPEIGVAADPAMESAASAQDPWADLACDAVNDQAAPGRRADPDALLEVARVALEGWGEDPPLGAMRTLFTDLIRLGADQM